MNEQANQTLNPRGERGAFHESAQHSFTLPSRYYHDPEIYQSELTHIFDRSWCYLGHASQLGEFGDSRSDQIADQYIRLERIDSTTIKAFIESQEINLVDCHGLLFGNLDPDATAFEQDFVGLSDIFGEKVPGLESYALAYELQFDIAANWKVVVDNFSEGYHIPVAHKKLSQVLESGSNNSAIVEDRFAFFESKSRSGFPGYELEPGLPYMSWTLWPNTCMLRQPGCDNLIVIRMAPNGATRCLERADILSPGGETNSQLQAIRDLFADNFNLEDISIVESVQRGLQSLGYDQSRYVADDMEAWYSESGLHKFHRLVLKALGSTS